MEFVFCIFIAYGGIFLMYMAAIMAAVGFGYDPEAFLNEYIGIVLWSALVLWMVILSIILLVRRYRKMKRVNRYEKSILKRNPFSWIGKRLALCIAGFLSTPFLVMLVHWGVKAMEESSFINTSSWGETLLSYISIVGVTVYALPLISTYFAFFAKEKSNNSSLKIIYNQTSDWIFSIITEDGAEEKFLIVWTRAGDKWIEFLGDFEDYKALESLVLDDPDNIIVERNAEYKNKIKYIRNKCEFYLWYIEVVDPWLDPRGDPYIEFGFVEKGHPKFEIYAAEALRLQLGLKERWRNKRRE